MFWYKECYLKLQVRKEITKMDHEEKKPQSQQAVETSMGFPRIFLLIRRVINSLLPNLAAKAQYSMSKAWLLLYNAWEGWGVLQLFLYNTQGTDLPICSLKLSTCDFLKPDNNQKRVWVTDRCTFLHENSIPNASVLMDASLTLCLLPTTLFQTPAAV